MLLGPLHTFSSRALHEASELSVPKTKFLVCATLPVLLDTLLRLCVRASA